MNNIEHYKSLISDEEVIKALLNDSKVRGELFKEKTRLKPNINFFHRTVTNLVSSNRRVTTTKELLNNDPRKPLSKVKGKVKTPHMLIKEIVMSNKTDLPQATGSKIDLTDEESNKTENAATQPSKSMEDSSPTEKTYREDLSKYFVREIDSKTNGKRSTQNYYVPPFKTMKSKSIVFNININKDSIGKPAGTSGKSLQRKKVCSSARKSIDKEVISVSSVSSFSDECEVIHIHESDSD